MDTLINLPALLAGATVACVAGLGGWSVLLRATGDQGGRQDPPPPPPDDPQRDPGWCHSHGKHRSEEED